MNDIKNPEELWAVQKAKLKLIFFHLTDEDFQYDYERKDDMLKLLELKLGKSCFCLEAASKSRDSL